VADTHNTILCHKNSSINYRAEDSTNSQKHSETHRNAITYRLFAYLYEELVSFERNLYDFRPETAGSTTTDHTQDCQYCEYQK